MADRIPAAEVVRQYRSRAVSASALAAELGLPPDRVRRIIRAAGVTRPPGRVSTALLDETERFIDAGAPPPPEKPYVGVHQVPIASVLIDSDAPSPAPSYFYDDRYSRAVRRAFLDDWWRVVSWSRDPRASDARVPCDLCGFETIGYVPTGGLVVCFDCWKATALPEERRQYAVHLRDLQRVRQTLHDDRGLRPYEYLPVRGPRRRRRQAQNALDVAAPQ